MGKTYSEQFRRQAVEMYRLDDDTNYTDVANDLGCSATAVAGWVKQADIDQGRVEGVTSHERDELAQLRADKLRLEKENRILKAATAYFAKDQL